MSIEEEVKTLIQGVYDQIGELTPSQQRLLVSDVLHIADNGLGQLSGTDSTQVSLVRGLIALAGYTNQVQSENKRDTVTGDTAVDKVLESYREVVTATATADMSPEDKKTADDMVDRVNKRVEKGEDFDTAMADEAKKLGGEWIEAVAKATPATSAGDEGGYGLYL